MTSNNQSKRSLIARLGAHKMHSLYDARATTAKARQSFLSKFEQQVDPDMILDPEERHKRAAHARKAHFIQLGFRSAEARQRKSDERNHS